jgi:hypothetical protein
MLEQALLDLESHEAKVQEAWVRVERESADLVRAQEQGESVDSLRLRDEDLRSAEGDLVMAVLEAQQLRKMLVTARAQLEEVEEELRRLGESGESGDDPISGTWRLVVEPGGMEGLVDFSLRGTLIEGTYSLAGGWSGSFRGTLVSGRVRLERIDSKLGFTSVFYGRLEDRDRPRLAGRWEARELSAGMPASGSWVAQRLEGDES